MPLDSILSVIIDEINFLSRSSNFNIRACALQLLIECLNNHMHPDIIAVAIEQVMNLKSDLS